VSAERNDVQAKPESNLTRQLQRHQLQRHDGLTQCCFLQSMGSSDGQKSTEKKQPQAAVVHQNCFRCLYLFACLFSHFTVHERLKLSIKK